MSAFKQKLLQLRDLMVLGKDFGKIMTFFFDQLGEDREFLRLGEPFEEERLREVLSKVMEAFCKRPVRLGESRLFRLAEEGFVHGSFLVEGKMASLLYFKEADTGLIALVNPGSRQTDFFRFTCHEVGLGPVWN